MKILYIFRSLNYSGAELMYVQAAERLKALGYELIALITAEDDGNYRKCFEEKGFKVFKIPCSYKQTSKIRFYQALTKLVKTEQVDILHVQRFDLFFVSACVAKRCHIKSVYSVNNTFTSNWYSYGYHFMLRHIARRFLGLKFHCGSDTVYQHELDYYHNKGIISYWWYDEKDFYPATVGEKKQSREKLSIADDRFVITTAGSCGYQKHHEAIFEALAQVKDDIPNLLFLHLGTGPQEDLEKDLCHQYQLDAHVRFCGNQSDFRSYLIASDLYVMTSRTEGLSNATIDALACRIPAVLYNVTGLRDYNIDGENVELIPEDSNCLAEAIRKLYSDRQRMEELAERGCRLVTKKYGSKYCIDHLVKTFYQS